MLWLIYIMLTDILWLICWLILCWILKNNVCWLIYHTLKNLVKAICCFVGVDCIETARIIGNIATEQFFCCCKFLKLPAWSLFGCVDQRTHFSGCCYKLAVVYLKLVYFVYWRSLCMLTWSLHCIHLGRDCRPARLLFFSLSY